MENTTQNLRKGEIFLWKSWKFVFWFHTRLVVFIFWPSQWLDILESEIYFQIKPFTLQDLSTFDFQDIGCVYSPLLFFLDHLYFNRVFQFL